MKLHMIRLASVLALSATFAVGCSDALTSVDESSSTASLALADPYSFARVNEQELLDFSELPSASDIVESPALYSMLDSGAQDPSHRGPGRGPHGPRGPRHPGDSTRMDSTRGPGHPHDSTDLGHGRDSSGGGGGRWFDRGNGRHFGRATMIDQRRLVRALGLTAEQDSLLRGLIADYRACAQDDFETYRTAREQAFDAMKVAVAAVRAEVEAGTLTADEARTQIDALRESYRAEVEGLNATLRAAVDACRATFDSSFEAILTPEQLEIWNTIKG